MPYRYPLKPITPRPVTRKEACALLDVTYFCYCDPQGYETWTDRSSKKTFCYGCSGQIKENP